MKVAVVTPTIGSEYLSQCVNSVDKQTYSDLTHYIFMDGKEHWEKINDTISGATKVKTIALEENVGKGWYGHRVYSACSFLVISACLVGSEMCIRDRFAILMKTTGLIPTTLKSLFEKLNRGMIGFFL